VYAGQNLREPAQESEKLAPRRNFLDFDIGQFRSTHHRHSTSKNFLKFNTLDCEKQILICKYLVNIHPQTEYSFFHVQTRNEQKSRAIPVVNRH